jgi:tetratricopeptide (TPR) repeat protein
MLAQERGEYAEAERGYRRALEINERLGDQAGTATSYSQLGILARLRGDYAEAEQEYRRALDIEERLGNVAGMAASYSQLGILEASRDAAESAIAWHVRALAIRYRLRVPEVLFDLRRLAEHRASLGPHRFTAIVIDAVGGPEQADAIISMLDQTDAGPVGADDG